MSTSLPSDRTMNFYNETAKDYRDRTMNLDMGPLYAPFLSRLPAGGHILDAGCGPGRDARVFKDLGFVVTAIDGSPEMCHLAGEHLGQHVHRMGFLDIEWVRRFDGIWACASLLHVHPRDLPDAFQRLTNALKRPGVLYASFKHGKTQGMRGGRWFTDLTETTLRDAMQHSPELIIRELWRTADLREGRQNEIWLNAIATLDEDA